MTMGPMKSKNMFRRLGGRGFRNQALEQDFQTSFRSYGVRFLFISATLSSAYFMVFLVADLVAGANSLNTPVQISRALLCLMLLGFGVAALRFKNTMARHYTLACTVIVLLVCMASTQIIVMRHGSDTATSMIWGLTSASVFATMLIFGFARLKPIPTTVLSLTPRSSAISFSSRPANTCSSTSSR